MLDPRSPDEQELLKQLIIIINNSTHSKTFKAKQHIRLDGGKMARKGFWIPKTLYDELNKAAADKGLTLQEYMDQLLEPILFADWEAVEERKA
jgi:hypothetical protein